MATKTKFIVIIEITCHNAEEVMQAKEIVLYHLETLWPEFSFEGNKLTARVQPLDPSLFGREEGLEILRQTLSQSLAFVDSLTCTLHETRR